MKKILVLVVMLIAVISSSVVIAGVGIYWTVTNNTKVSGDFTTCPLNMACADSRVVNLAPGQTGKNITYQEAPGSLGDRAFSTQQSIYVNNNKICTVNFWGITYYQFGPRMRYEGISVTQMFNNEYVSCQFPTYSKQTASGGDTEFITVAIVPSGLKPLTPSHPLPLNPPNMQPLYYIKNSQVRGPYYDVHCLNGASATFYPSSPGTCYDYTNGIKTYSTPQTCYPEFRTPTLNEFDEEVGKPFCIQPK